MAVKSQQQQIDAANDNILVIVGRLLEATQASSDGIKTLSQEARQNAAASQAAQQAVTTVQHTVMEIDRIIRSGNGESLVTQVRLATEDHVRLTKDLNDLVLEFQTVSNRLSERLTDLEHGKSKIAGGSNVVFYSVAGLAWAITTAIALFAALKGQ